MTREEQWSVRELKPGDIIRVDAGRFYHMGIYIGDEQVIHFAGPTPGQLTDADLAIIRQDSLETFAMQGPVEVRDYSLRERLKKRSPERIIEEARSRLGQGNYDIIYNNCEHFVNLCAFGVPYSAQIDRMREAAGQEGK